MSDVDVEGTLFDVTFVDTSCAELYQGCDEDSDFPINRTQASSLARTLLNLFDEPENDRFDDNPELISGCTSTFACRVVFPFAADSGQTNLSDDAFQGVIFRNGGGPNNSNDSETIPTSFSLSVFGRSFDYGGSAAFTLAQVTRSDAPVSDAVIPLPAAGWMLLAGIGALGFLRRRASA